MRKYLLSFRRHFTFMLTRANFRLKLLEQVISLTTFFNFVGHIFDINL